MERQYQILIVDENFELLNTYHQFLTQHGFQVETAQDGLDGLEKLRHGEFDVALVSLQLPGLNGLDLIRRATEEEIETDMIVLSGPKEGNREEAITALNAGVKAWFEKSGLFLGELLKKLKELTGFMSLTEIEQLLAALPKQD
jgi:DNA-binding response OmpR family regulator